MNCYHIIINMMKMKNQIHSLIIPIFILILTIFQGCSDNTELDRQPDAVQKLIEQYYPGIGVSSSGWQDNVYSVKLRSGVIINFSDTYNWISINGVGSTIPSVFLFDQIPPAFYEYLQETENINQVYRISRDNEEYTAVLLNDTAIYNINDGTITIPVSGEALNFLIAGT